MCLDNMPHLHLAYIPDVVPIGATIREPSEAGAWWYSLNEHQLADYLSQLRTMLDSFDSDYLTGFAVANPLRALNRCRGNLNCFVRSIILVLLSPFLFYADVCKFLRDNPC